MIACGVHCTVAARERDKSPGIGWPKQATVTDSCCAKGGKLVNRMMTTSELVLKGRYYSNGQVVTVRIDQGRIAAIEPLSEADAPEGIERWIVPGFLDLQVNGFAGRGFTDPRVSVDDVKHIARKILATGVTRFLPTIVTADLAVMCRQLSVIAEAIDHDEQVAAMCPGVHVEGPFIHPEDGPRGAHPREHVRQPSIADFERLYHAARGRIAVLTLAPEQPGAVQLITHARAMGVVVALGHHRAETADLERAIRAGAAMTTHLGNGSDAMMPRLDNVIWRQLGEDRLWASLITDGHHLPAVTVRCMLRAKTPARCVLVTDAVAAAGMPPGRYHLGDTEVERLPDGRVILPGTPFQAGSSAEMSTVLTRAIVDGGVSLIEAVTMASINPATLLFGQADPWSSTSGGPANLVELEWDPRKQKMTVRSVVFGQWSAAQTGDD